MEPHENAPFSTMIIAMLIKVPTAGSMFSDGLLPSDMLTTSHPLQDFW